MAQVEQGRDDAKFIAGQYLQHVLVRDLVENKEDQSILEVDCNTPLVEVLQILRQHSILSVPVWNEDTGNYDGFVDVMDILAFVLETVSSSHDAKEMQWSTWVEDVDTLTNRGILFGIKPVKHILNKSSIDKFFPVYPHGTVFQLIEGIFCKGIHRVPVMDERNRVINVVSQSDVIGLLGNSLIQFGTFGQKTVEELKLGNREVISMSVNAQAIQAFYLMHVNKVSAVAIVDEKGTLVANLSASDIRGLTPKLFPALVKPCTNYLIGRYGHVKSPITCRLTSSLQSVIMKLSLYRLHRLWIVDEKEKPIGLITLTDVMKMISEIPTD